MRIEGRLNKIKTAPSPINQSSLRFTEKETLASPRKTPIQPITIPEKKPIRPHKTEVPEELDQKEAKPNFRARFMMWFGENVAIPLNRFLLGEWR